MMKHGGCLRRYMNMHKLPTNFSINFSSIIIYDSFMFIPDYSCYAVGKNKGRKPKKLFNVVPCCFK